MQASIKVLRWVVNVPDITTQCVGSSLQCPGEECELAAEPSLVEQVRMRMQLGEMLSERAQSVFTTTMQNVTEWSLHH